MVAYPTYTNYTNCVFIFLHISKHFFVGIHCKAIRRKISEYLYLIQFLKYNFMFISEIFIIL